MASVGHRKPPELIKSNNLKMLCVMADKIEIIKNLLAVKDKNGYEIFKLLLQSMSDLDTGKFLNELRYCVELSEGNQVNSKNANCAIFDVSKSYYGEQGDDNMKADIKEIMYACGDKFDFIRLCNEAQEELDEAAFDLDQESRMNGV